MTRAVPISFLAAALALSACGDDEDLTKSTTSTSASGAAACEEAEAPPAKNVKLAPPSKSVKGEDITALVETSCGDFEITLDTEGAPTTASSFVQMTEQGVYDDTTFHRMVPGFVIQGGDPRGDGTGDAGYTVEETPPPDVLYTDGVVAMAKTGAEPPGTSGSQFFVVVSPDAGLPADYAVLGEVASGGETVDAIAGQGDPQAGQAGTPLQPVVIKKISLR